MLTKPRQNFCMLVNGGAVHDQPVAHVEDAMAVGGGLGIVGDHHDGLAEVFVERGKQIENRLGALGIEVSGGLIGEDDFGFADNGPCDRDPLLFAARHFRWLVLQTPADSEKIGDNFEAVRIESVSANVLGEDDVVVGVERGQKVEALKNEADFVAAQHRAGCVGHSGEIVAIEKDFPARGLGQATNHVEHCGFSATGGAHDGNKLAGKNLDVDAAQGRHVHFARAINFPQIFGLKYRLQLPGPRANVHGICCDSILDAIHASDQRASMRERHS